MGVYFKPEDIAELEAGLRKLNASRTDLLQRYLMYSYRTQIGEEHGKQGLGRRLGTMQRCVENVFELLPPDFNEIPDKNSTKNAEISIQAFVMNVFGCIENLAWVWAHEKGVTQPDGTPLDAVMIGLSEQKKFMWRSMRAELRQYLIDQKQWFSHIKNFRDSLAHRIPLYIPPYVVAPKNVEEYHRLERRANEVLLAGHVEEYHRLMDEQRKLCFFRPWMTHSFLEKSPHVVFHAQLLADFITVVELGGKMADELDMLAIN